MSDPIKHDPSSQCARILRHLKKHGKMTNIEMWNMRIQRGSERIRNLKSEGYLINSIKLDRTTWVYVYCGHESEQS